MSQQTAALLAKLEGQRMITVLPRLRGLLESPEGRVLTQSSFHPTVSVLEPIWRVRLQHSQAQGNEIDGLTELLSRLQSLSPNQTIQQFGVTGAEDAGNIFFNVDTGELLGAVIVAMSDHTRAYLRGDLKGRPFDTRSSKRKSAMPAQRQTVKAKKALV